MRAEDGQARGTFGEVEGQRGEARDGPEHHADQDHSEGLEGERNGGEGQRQRDVRADGDESGGGYGEGDLASERIGQRFGAMCEGYRGR